MKTVVVLLVLLFGVISGLKVNKANVDRKALENLVRERIAKKTAQDALAKALDIEVSNVVDQVEEALDENSASNESDNDKGGINGDKVGKRQQLRADSGKQAVDSSKIEQQQPDQVKIDPEQDAQPAKRKDKNQKSWATDNIMGDVLDAPEDANLGVTSLKTKSEIAQVEWCRNGVVFMRTVRGRVYRSTDNGQNWVDLSTNLKSLKKSGSVTIDRVEINPVDIGQVVLIGKGPFGFISNNGGETFVFYDGMAVSSFQFHPYEQSWILALVLTPACASTQKQKSEACYQQLMYSHDLGASWSKIADYVSSADWQRINLQDPSAKDTVFACLARTKSGDQSFSADSMLDLFASKDYFSTPATLLLANANSFIQPNSRLIYASVASLDRSSKHLINLYVSAPESDELPKFTRANLPTLGQRSFTIVDASEQSVFIHINHEDADDPSGSVYMSDSSGMQFSLSLPNNRRSPEGVADFQRVSGLEGVYIANYLHHEDSTGAVVNHWQGMGRKLDRSTASVRTAITFDKGAIWSYLSPPKTDALGNEIPCSQTESCFLHLHGISDKYGAMHCARSAVGLIMASGSIGDALGDIGTATYLSRDAGLTWQQVAKGSHVYQFSNHGALIVMAPDTAPTHHVLYSWDQGLSWYRVKVSQTPIQISRIAVDPNGGSQYFLFHGADTSGNGVVVHLDLSGLHERVCEEADFEEWTPIDDRGESSCIMGHKVSYTRRKRDAQCYNPQTYQVGQFKGDCPCTDRDFECDVGFARNADVCEPVDDLVPKIEDQCNQNGVHRVTKGYRRIPGNTCFDGEKWDLQIIPCSTFPKKSGHAFLLTLLMVAIAMAAVVLLSKSNLCDFGWCFDKFRSKLGTFGYSAMSKKTISDEEFEEFGAGPFRAHHIADDDFDQDLQDDADELQYSHPIPPMPGLVQRQSGPIPRIQGPKSDQQNIEA